MSLSELLSMQHKYCAFISTLKGKAADLTVVQKIIIDSHKEGSPEPKVIAERVACVQSAVPIAYLWKIDWEGKLG